MSAKEAPPRARLARSRSPGDDEALNAPPFEYDTVAFTLEPSNPRAAALRVEVWNHTWAISIGITRHALERMPGDVPDRHAELAEIVRAVVDGRYEHRYRQVRIRLLLRPWRHRSLTEFVGMLRLETGPLEFSHAGLEPPGLETEPVTYEPYLTSESGRG